MTIIASSHMLRMMQDPIKDQRAWLEDVLARLRITATELARRANLNPSTLTRFLAPDGREGHTLSTRTISKINAAVDQMSQQRHGSAGGGFAEREAAVFDVENAPEKSLGTAVEAIQAGRNGIDAWELVTSHLEDLRLYAGDILIVDMNATPQPGDLVCVQKTDWPSGEADTVFRLYEPPYLLTGSLVGRNRKPEVADDRINVIRGVVIARLSPRTMLHHTNAA